MNVAFVKNGEDDVHHEHRERHQDRQTGNCVAERLRLALQFSAHALRHDLRCRSRDEIGCVAQRLARFQVEEERHAGELVQVVDDLWSKRRFPRDEFAQRHEITAVVGFDVEQ